MRSSEHSARHRVGTQRWLFQIMGRLALRRTMPEAVPRFERMLEQHRGLRLLGRRTTPKVCGVPENILCGASNYVSNLRELLSQRLMSAYGV